MALTSGEFPYQMDTGACPGGGDSNIKKGRGARRLA